MAELAAVGSAVARPLVAVAVLLWGSGLAAPLVAVAVAGAAALAVAPAVWPWLLARPAGSSAELMLAYEVVRGVGLGALALAPLWVAKVAAGWVGAALYDSPRASEPLRALYVLTAGAAFLAVDGPVLVAAALEASYRTAPPGAPLALGSAVEALAWWAGHAVRLAAPLVVAAALAQLCWAAAQRAAAATAESLPRALVAPTLVLVAVAALLPLLAGALVALWRAALQ